MSSKKMKSSLTTFIFLKGIQKKKKNWKTRSDLTAHQCFASLSHVIAQISSFQRHLRKCDLLIFCCDYWINQLGNLKREVIVVFLAGPSCWLGIISIFQLLCHSFGNVLSLAISSELLGLCWWKDDSFTSILQGSSSSVLNQLRARRAREILNTVFSLYC